MNPATALATVLVDELARCGLTDVVLAPGSRSAPLALAVHADSRIRLHVRVDERSASFLAVGLARRSERPVALICTSGTAAANFHPAVVEAHESGVPLLLLTADRPPELRDTGASQTVDQIKLYGAAVRWFSEVGAPEERPGQVAYWRSLACRAYQRSLGPYDPGPVHLNMAFREPLIPDGDDSWCEPMEGAAGGPRVRARVTSPPVALHVPPTRRGVLVVGDGATNTRRYVAAAGMAGWPVLSEPNGGARYGDHAMSAYHFLLGTPEFADRHRPDVVVTLGRPGLSKPLLGWLGQAGEHIVVASDLTRWPDPTRSATQVAQAVEIPFTARDDTWLDSWRRADAAARAAIDAVLDDSGLSEPRVARDLAEALPNGSLLFSGSSMPIRDLDQAMRPRRGLRILASRGAAGIDGVVSAAMGAALAHNGPAYALMGDLTFLHDQNGLILGPREPRPDLCLVVVNNDGGGIFSLLPQAALRDPFERVFGTAHGVDLAHVAAATGTPYTLVDEPGQLVKALPGEGVRIVEVRTERGANAALHATMREAAHTAVRAVL
ncbi:2-succinyl-5-enolpyruvyl-6-hydroxy-3-cyclohexene-1-carboxylate synthase [Streptosporangium becharense]|uniref:2-succinyl-5-enolpyruvyl-6-hydroxy-3-cyclohexene-1-carboxylate synthase n=1 Tax=Streptosporangium becharense TaxID=1816182 RepID=A0A7W9IC04_9ACTN|nr:2-succinyl-5-enolpyruvyl-6-hydroxy-3-cyclohexene-1-carboxylic-acid synthase [Streptosporangium becharense]MBB2915434.1 2-succinyl-5-enolpyruvyl-6-hydroxy-3-cyclohexene-1-carboxylate synthase [Streptosporangium becharense]MBB5817621.1 2-succinyl-5-enolpyruvyl-6-hydroxy-3-cyclohexene-1-carboxylate synthase [Streptosporangium becharense]